MTGPVALSGGGQELPQGHFTLLNATVPACFLVTLPAGSTVDRDGCVALDIGVIDGRIAGLKPAGAGTGQGPPAIDLRRRQVWATLVDMHTHLDKGQVIPRARPDGTLNGGSNGTVADRRHWSPDDIAARMEFGLRCAYAHGVSAIRTHLDSHHDIAHRSWDVFRQLRATWAGKVELQAVGLVPLAAFDTPWGEALADLVLSSGGVLGGVTDALGPYEGAAGETLERLLDVFLGVAAARGLDVDLHVDQSDALDIFALPHIAEAVMRNRFAGTVVCGHCVNLALQPDAVAQRTIGLCADANLAFVTLPTPMMYLQDRKPGRTPRWRGVTLAQELLDAGLRVAIAGDNCRDAWFPFGDHDMIDTLHQSVRVLQIDDPFARAVAMAGPTPAGIIGVVPAGHLIEDGPADFIILTARTLNEAMCRPQADRIVVRAGMRVIETAPPYEALDGLLDAGQAR